MKVRVILLVSLLVAVVVGLLIGFAGSSAGPVAASGVAAPNVTNTPHPTAVPLPRGWDSFVLRDLSPTPPLASAYWSAIQGQRRWGRPTAGNTLRVTLAAVGSLGVDYNVLYVSSSSVSQEGWQWFVVPESGSQRFYIVDVTYCPGDGCGIP